MSGWMIIIPLAGCITGWLINRFIAWIIFYPLQPKNIAGLQLQGIIPSKKEKIAESIAHAAKEWFINSGFLEKKISDPENFRKMRPMIEEQTDQFLRIKLKESMPVIGMFIGDKTINQLKEIFTAELEKIFPVVMKNYIGHLQGKSDPAHLIKEQLNAIPDAVVVQKIRNGMSKELALFQWAGVVSGLLIGIISVLLFVFLHP